MEPEEKISPEFRDRLATLGDDETICALIALQTSLPDKPPKRDRVRREKILASVEAQTDDALAELVEAVRETGGEILSISRPLSIVTIQAGRGLIERLSESDTVKAIFENQPVHSIDTIK